MYLKLVRIVLFVLAMGLGYQALSMMPPGDKVTQLMFAASYGYPQQVEQLITQGVDVNSQDKNGYTALLHAVLMRYPSIVNLLLSKGADPNIASDNGTTPLHAAALNSDSSMVNLLLSNGAQVRADVNNATPLHAAAQNGNTAIAYILLNRIGPGHLIISKADTRYGKTALHQAASYGHHEIVNLLLDYGADKTKRTFEGKTALDLAYENKALYVKYPYMRRPDLSVEQAEKQYYHIIRMLW